MYNYALANINKAPMGAFLYRSLEFILHCSVTVTISIYFLIDDTFTYYCGKVVLKLMDSFVLYISSI